MSEEEIEEDERLEADGFKRFSVPHKVTCPGCDCEIERHTNVPVKRCYCGTLLFFKEE